MKKIIIFVGIILISSCSASKKTSCDAYGKVEMKKENKAI
jgi:hypothetical protein